MLLTLLCCVGVVIVLLGDAIKFEDVSFFLFFFFSTQSKTKTKTNLVVVLFCFSLSVI
jgi:hypothetical protein